MKRLSAVLAALGVAVATAATAWAIGVNTGVFDGDAKREPVSARVEVSQTAAPEIVETIYVDVPADASPSGETVAGGSSQPEVGSSGESATTSAASSSASSSQGSRGGEPDDDDDDDRSESHRETRPSKSGQEQSKPHDEPDDD